MDKDTKKRAIVLRGKLFLVFSLSLLITIISSCQDQSKTIIVEAENFDTTGGWVVDQQSIDQIGSSYLLAHGLGTPCEDAVTKINFESRGKYHVWVRTRNWAPAPKKTLSAGRFMVKINNQSLDTIFGQDQTKWNWQYGGEVDISNKVAEIRLHDLTGFEGRCDALIFSREKDLITHQSEDPLIELRKRAQKFPENPASQGNFDLVVVGGGVAGVTTSITASRLGLKVALIHNRPVLGGNNSSEVGIVMVSDLNMAPYPNLGNLTKQIGETNADKGMFGRFDDKPTMNLVAREPNITLFLNMHVTKANVANSIINSVVAQHIITNREVLVSGRLFADCTGDGNLGFAAGADFNYGRESKNETNEPIAPEKADSLVLGASLGWHTSDRGKEVLFPECPWAMTFSEESCQNAFKGIWNWETGFQYDMVNQTEFIRDNMFRAIYGNWSFQKNHSQFSEKYMAYSLDRVGYILGKRESRRLLGEIVYSQNDIVDSISYPDACVSTKWGIDLHYPDPENTKYFPGIEFRSSSYHPLSQKHPARSLPYRCFYSRNISNLFMAGRCVSMTHIAHGMFRCQNTTGMMGEVVGMAASICIENQSFPRDIYPGFWPEMEELLKKGI